MKFKGKNFAQFNRDFWKQGVPPSTEAIALYTWLTELEHRYTNGWDGKDYFWQTAEDLARAIGKSVPVVRRSRRELEKAGMIETWLFHPPANSNKNGKGPYRKAAVMAFRLK